MPDLTFDLPDAVHDQLCKLAESGGIDAEHLVRQMIALRVGSNTSSKEDPFSTVLLEQQTEQILHLAETAPVYLNDPENGDFVMV